MSHEILIVTPDHQTRRLTLEHGEVSLGRAHTNDLCYPEDASLSRQHLKLSVRDGNVWVEDLGSKNGTLLNGVRLTAAQQMRPGDRLVVGHLEINLVDPTGESPVVFVPETGPDMQTQGTVMTRLADLLSNEATAPLLQVSRPSIKTSPAAATPAAPQPMPQQSPFEGPVVKAMLRAGRELAEHRPLGELFQLILDMSIEAVGAERGVLLVLEGERLVSKAVHGDSFRISATVRDKVIKEKTSLLVRDMAQEEAFRERLSISAQNIHTMMAAPLQTETAVIGLIYVDSRMWMREFTGDDLNLLTFLGNVAAIRIEQENLAQLEHDSEQAAIIQRGILPGDAPDVPGVDLGGHNEPCRTIGGDYYDFFAYPDGRVGIVLADVAGKGISAAMLMSNLQARVQMLAEGVPPEDLGTLVSKLDRSLAAHCPQNRFITMFFSVFNPATGDLTYVNAGHNPPLIVRGDGHVDSLPPDGTVLGMLPELGYDQKVVNLKPGDMLAIFSDGVTETENHDGAEFGEERLAATLKKYRDQPSLQAIQSIMGDVTTFSENAPAIDDVTLVVVRRTA